MNVGILGYGSIGNRHCENLDSLGIRWVLYEPRHGHHHLHRDDLIQGSDAIIICSPSQEHNKDILDCVDLGRNFLCEKPFGYDHPEILDQCIKIQRPIWPMTIMATGFNLRFHHCVQKAHDILPELGDIQFAHFTVLQKTEKPVYLRDGILRNWCSHEIDLANYLLGPGGEVLNCTVKGENGREDEDTEEAFITMKYPSVENRVFIHADYISDPERRFFWIEGTKGSLYVDLVGRNVFRKDNNGKRWQALAATDSFDQNYVDEMKCFLASIEAGKHLAPLATAEDGVIALYQVMEARKKAGLK